MTQGIVNIMPSSWIRNVRYDYMSGRLEINMRGKWFGPWFVSPRIFQKFIQGKAVPITTDSRRSPRWERGIGPSLGAAYHKYIKITGKSQRIGRYISEFGAKAGKARYYVKPPLSRSLQGKVTKKYRRLSSK